MLRLSQYPNLHLCSVQYIYSTVKKFLCLHSEIKYLATYSYTNTANYTKHGIIILTLSLLLYFKMQNTIQYSIKREGEQGGGGGGGGRVEENFITT
jgi:hypothetical protein